MRKIAVGSSAVLTLSLLSFVLYLDHRWEFLLRDRHSALEMNGVAIDGDVLERDFFAIVTRRDAGKQHSYLLSFAGDVDPVGNIGSVTDCHDWVAPRFPLLILTRTYPPCTMRQGEDKQSWVWSLKLHEKGEKFSTPTQEVIVISRRRRH